MFLFIPAILVLPAGHKIFILAFKKAHTLNAHLQNSLSGKGETP
jgi:hypothetical protein